MLQVSDKIQVTEELIAIVLMLEKENSKKLNAQKDHVNFLRDLKYIERLVYLCGIKILLVVLYQSNED